MRRLTLTWLLLAVAQTASGDQSLPDVPLEDALSCSKKIPIDTRYSSEGNIRVDQAFICVSKDTRTTALHFRASAMHQQSFTGTSQSPWISLRVLDRSNNVLFQDASFKLADVARCGGYTGHWKLIPIGNKASEIYSFDISMGGAKPKDCKPQGFDRFVYDVKHNALRYAKGELTDDERAILEFAKAAAASGK